ncbi:MAG: hypothetical protein JSU93_04005 [Methanobacteriota archaeon]|nr:MAG: hypothetical protein JSU93_04005 [Euryarchaeota archaeon]
MPDGMGGKLCPICDSPLEPGSKKCGFCGTDLAIFDNEAEASKIDEKSAAEEKVASEALDTKLEEVFFGEAEKAPEADAEPKAPSEPATEEPPKPAAPPQPAPAPEPAPTPAAEPEPEPKPEVSVKPEPTSELEPEKRAPEESFFKCPECNAQVPIAANSCSNCGVMFADEGEDMFQCPACNSLVKIDATSCPGCGALFVDSEEAAAAQPSEPAPAPAQEFKPELERPVEEVVAEPEATMMEPSEAEEAEGARKGLFGAIFGKKKRRKRETEPDQEAAPDEWVEPEPISREPVQERAPTSAEPPSRYEPSVSRPPTIAEPAVERPPVSAPQVPPKHKPKELARLTAEMQPLMRLASDNGVDVSECRRLVDEGAMAARARRIDEAFDSVMRARELLMRNLADSTEQLLSDLRAEVDVAKTLGGDVSRTAAYLEQLKKADDASDFEAVYVYAGKVKNELLPITGRYNESKQKLGSLTNLVADSELIDVDTKEARLLLTEATRAFEANEFDRVDETVRSATKSLYAAIEPRMEDEIRRARNQLVEVKAKGLNITPMITVLKSARTLMKSKDYQQALKEMREFKAQLEKAL